MKRREFLHLSLGAALAAAPATAGAWMACGPFTINGAKYCYAGIRSDLQHVPAAAIDGRHTRRWSWAACAEMLCGYAGHRVSQQRIVTDTWGSIGSVPDDGNTILADLDGEWIDDAGRAFRVRSERLPLSPQAASGVLEQDRPLLLLTPTHPVVLTMMRFVSLDDSRGDVQAVHASDPRRASGPHRFAVSDWYDASLLAALHIERA